MEKFLTDMMGLLNDIMASVECDNVTCYMKSIYVSHKMKAKEVTFMEYLTFGEKLNTTSSTALSYG